MVEVLDHYHGPAQRKLWLLAFAESASDQTRTGWSPRWKLAHRADMLPHHASRTARQLIDEGVIKRHGGGYSGQTAVYELLPLAPGNPPGRVPPEVPIRRGERVPTATGKGTHSAGKGTSGGTPSLISPHIPQSARASADIIRAAFPGVTDDEIETITRETGRRGARNTAAVIRHEAAQGTLRLPCDRDGDGRHSSACRDGDSGLCGANWCACRCHIKPEASP